VYLVAILLLGGDPSSAPGSGTASCGEGFDRGPTGEVLPRGEQSARLIGVGLLVAALAVAVT